MGNSALDRPAWSGGVAFLERHLQGLPLHQGQTYVRRNLSDTHQ